MRLLHSADWHIGNFPGPEREGKNLRAEDTGMCIQHLYDIAQLRSPDMVLISGDVFHQARVWADRGLAETKVAIQAIEAISDICPTVVMRGTPNHDGAEQFEMLKAHFRANDNVHIVTEPEVLQVEIHDEWVNIACLPGFDRGVYRAKFPGLSKEEENQVFTNELGKIVLALKAQCDPAFKSVLMSHYTVPGCNTESGQTQFLAQFEPMLLPEVLDAAAFDLVALGHIHRPQQVQSCKNTFYSGAINAMNFNDEGQKRGFYIHDLDKDTHDFYETPYREFVTFQFNDTEITALNNGSINPVADNFWACNDGVKNKIVRVLYSCSEENNKAFNKSLLEQRLYADGAFWVSEISPEKVCIGTNKNELSEKTDPEANLVSYLNERAYTNEDITSMIEVARPIIAEAIAGNIESTLTGAFVPIEIAVKNYRNYAEETFDFRDIAFCTINGKNGVGKSSLFMDAILDCLFEEPREGDLTGWIRADEKARSGSITFTFSIGDKVFRVARTRAKSGKATLNLSEKVDGEWENRSCEKIRDTQDKIIATLGMDSLTFRSCALIMQDQYGLFLEASKEDRMSILGNILGLSIYNDMETLTRSRLSDNNREINKRNVVIDNLSDEIANADELTFEYKAISEDAINLQEEINVQQKSLNDLNIKASKKQETLSAMLAVKNDIQVTDQKIESTKENISQQKTVHENTMRVLELKDTITSEVTRYHALLEDEKVLLSDKAKISAELVHIKNSVREAEEIKTKLARNIEDRKQLQTTVERCLKALEREDKLRTIVCEYEKLQSQITFLSSREPIYQELTESITTAERKYSTHKNNFELEAQHRKSTIEIYEKKADMLGRCNCIDVNTADCVFLKDAKEAKKQLDAYRAECTEWKNTELLKLDELKQNMENLKRQRDEVGFDAGKLLNLRKSAEVLASDVKEYEKLSSIKDTMQLHNDHIKKCDRDIEELSGRLKELKHQHLEYEKLLKRELEIDDHTKELQVKIKLSAEWVEKQKMIPVAEERKINALKRIDELTAGLSELEQAHDGLLLRHKDLLREIEEFNGLDDTLLRTQNLLKTSTDKLSKMQIEIGALSAKLDSINERRKEIRTLQSEINKLSETSSVLEELKTAFSQDGIPHNIIRSILPILTSTANEILGQMTGGKMGMEFVTDKVLKSNSKKEIPTLDIVINEYGKDTLPYLSKSGGEKVKASLSAILSLAEIKSSQAGITLGMLFIDEPPFLDADGIQAYCDALETIQRRYSGLKVMAITHDPTMKARFPQSIDVIKDEHGSRIQL